MNGKDYTQTLTAYPSSFPNGTVIQWSWPTTPNTSQPYGYPEVIYGNQNGNVFPSPNDIKPTPMSVNSLSALTGTFNLSIRGSTEGFDVLWETQLTNGPSGPQVAEVGFMLHAPQFMRDYLLSLSQTYNYSGNDGLSATICIVPDNGGGYPFIVILPNNGDFLSGTIDVLGVYRFLVLQGVLSGSEYVVGQEMGVEPFSGSGSLTINQLNYDWH